MCIQLYILLLSRALSTLPQYQSAAVVIDGGPRTTAQEAGPGHGGRQSPAHRRGDNKQHAQALPHLLRPGAECAHRPQPFQSND
jgi:hypothetical protein